MPDADATWSSAPEVTRRLAATRFHEIRWFTAIDSTNRHLLLEAARGCGEGVVAVADEQTAGRGRHGRTWVAAPGAALLASVLLRPDLPPERLHLVTLAVGVAASEAVAAVGGFDAGLKWPNDLVVDDRKLAGILAEAAGTRSAGTGSAGTGSGGAGAVVVGMGLNLRSDAFAPEIADTATACDRHAAHAVDRAELLVAWLLRLDHWLGSLDHVVTAATSRSATLGRDVHVELARDSFSGVATGMTPEGYLVVTRPDGTEQTVTAGDVIHLRGRGRAS
ncbi:MAG: BirA family transcriptional regulator [Actinomycetota bacterium]|nr:BirA family transcriptional regulator [Actinomycetota bacterium]